MALTLVQHSILKISDTVNVSVISNCCSSSISTNSQISVLPGGESGEAVAFPFHPFYTISNTFHSEVSVTLSHNETGVIILAQFAPVVHTGATSTCDTFHCAHLITRRQMREGMQELHACPSLEQEVFSPFSIRKLEFCDIYASYFHLRKREHMNQMAAFGSGDL